MAEVEKDFDKDYVAEHDDDEDMNVRHKFSWKTWLWRVGAAVAVIVALLIAYAIGSASGATKANPGPAPVQAIKSQNKVLDELESLKDSQIRAMNQDVMQLQQTDADGMSTASDETKTLAKATSQASEKVNDYMDRFYQMSIKASPAEQKLVSADLAKLSPLTAKGDKDTTVQATIKGGSPAKDVKTNGKKAGPADLFLVGSEGGNKVFVAVAPFATEKNLYSTISVVKTDGQVIADYRYIGLVKSNKAGDLDRAIADMKSAK